MQMALIALSRRERACSAFRNINLGKLQITRTFAHITNIIKKLMKHFTLLLLSLLTLTVAQAQTPMAEVPAEDYPFVITTDTNAPALYYVYSGRDGNGAAGGCVFTNEVPWKETQNKLTLTYRNPNEAALNQLWYFMEAADGKIMIISAADGRMVTVANTTDGTKKVYMQTEAERTNDHYTWTLDKTNNCYAFRTSDGKTFLSHNGNWVSAGPQMGLYNANGSKDEGSRVFFEACETPSGINGVRVTPSRSGIYTLTGTRIPRITAPGIYIIDGSKRIVR